MDLVNTAKIRDELAEEIRKYCEKAGVKRIVLGVSGGKDSSVAAALSARALGPENVFGVMLPDGAQKDIADSRRVCESLGIRAFTVNIGAIHEALLEAVKEGFPAEDLLIPYGETAERESNINVGPRLRMTTLRYIAQALGAFLCGTGNLSESYVGYCTKDGDTSCDFNPLGRLTSKEVVQLGLSMPELPCELVEKAPADGLSGHTDEERLGVTYQEIHDLIRYGSSGNPEADEIIRRKHRSSAHKRAMPTVLVSETFLSEGHEFHED
ncbi:MAG: NAD(+) synthase [Lachnospiraceae bacterium]|nr:NAD(+) synthase [Lachnospiraceae bacterium]